MRANSSSSGTLEPLKNGCGVTKSKPRNSARNPTARSAEFVDFHLELIHPGFTRVFQVLKRRDHFRVGDHQKMIDAGAGFGGKGLGDAAMGVLKKST